MKTLILPLLIAVPSALSAAGFSVPRPALVPAPVSYYKGTMTANGQTREICFALDPKRVDSFEGDPDVSQGVFVSQAIPEFLEQGYPPCATALDHNGETIKTCSGFFLTEAGSLKKGDVFADLRRFDPAGGYSIHPAGRWTLKQVPGCAGIAAAETVPVTDKEFRAAAERLADEANKEDGQLAVGELVGYTCGLGQRPGTTTCEFKYALGRDICWFGHEVIKADFELKDGKLAVTKSRRWERE